MNKFNINVKNKLRIQNNIMLYVDKIIKMQITIYLIYNFLYI